MYLLDAMPYNKMDTSTLKKLFIGICMKDINNVKSCKICMPGTQRHSLATCVMARRTYTISYVSNIIYYINNVLQLVQHSV